MFSLYYWAYFVSDDDVISRTKEAVTEDEIACFYPPLWFVIFTNVSSLFMTLNASLGFLIYCLGCSLFRAELRERLQRLRNNIRDKNAKLFDLIYCRREGILV